MAPDRVGGFEGLVAAPVEGLAAASGAAPAPADRLRSSPPDGIRTVARMSGPSTTRVVLVRHGEAECNVSGVCGGIKGCTGLTAKGVGQVTALADRLAVTGELAGADALYASVLPRAIETAELLAPALRSVGPDGSFGPTPTIIPECSLCELHPGEADGLTWEEFSARYEGPDWDEHPDHPIAPGGESWTGFVLRVAGALEAVAARHPGDLVVIACHAGVIEASLLAMLPLVDGRAGARLQLRTLHASLTTWEVDQGRWRLLGYNDASHLRLLDLRDARDPQDREGTVTTPKPMAAHPA
ncbi:MAG TPA: histidine phosphatase family protein [Acidimicrobiales bacterium]|jgi:probable phosphoglycerate mutase|nr:histidine phosphatase family protein [Acidimicrobiales bacterium]